METAEALETEIKELIIGSLVLEDLTPEDIDSTQTLFEEGLGLDSIDALEIAMALEERYGITTDDDPDANRERFASVKSLAAYITQSRTR